MGKVGVILSGGNIDAKTMGIILKSYFAAKTAKKIHPCHVKS